MRWQNAQLDTGLARARAELEKAESDGRAAQAALTTRVETLSASSERSAAEIARLRQELDGARQRLEAAGAAEARVAELEAKLQAAEARSRGFDGQLAGLQRQVDEVTGERDRALQRVAEVASERERLQAELATAQDEVGRALASRGQLEQEVGMLRAAASSAADAARQNLRAVEARIRELNRALAGIEPAAGVAAAAPLPPAVRPAAAVAEPRPDAGAAAGAQVAAAVDDDLALIKSATATEGPVGAALTRLTPDVPLEMRLQVQGLLVDLDAKVDGRGVKMTVPGGDLFEINSETIEPTAYDTLAKVAELIDAYGGHEVMIVGHTDSIGDEGYNRSLSRRRAELVKQFFVDNFDIAPGRLAVDGRGEAQPIATNATVTGRQANRRVEVLILD
jgi:outer membrane protein OmpA-like peptidoglycan-associated protein